MRRGFSAVALTLFLILTLFTFFLFTALPSSINSGFRDGMLALFVGFCALFVVLTLKTSGV